MEPKASVKKAEGLRDDLDDIDENDVGELIFFQTSGHCQMIRIKSLKNPLSSFQVKNVVWLS